MYAQPAGRQPRRDMSARRRAGIGVAIVDDHAAVREGLRALLDGEPMITPVGVAATAHDAVALVARSRPDVVLLDYHLPGEDGLSLCLRLKAADELPRVILYSAFADDELALLAAIAGADALIDKSSAPGEVCETVRAVARGERRTPSPSPTVLADAGARLDPSDLPVLGMLAQGTPADEAAARLGTTDAELAARRSAILARLQAPATVTPLHSRERPPHLPTPS
jgi:DNA-binding NarL/FixJ family response regulator